MYVTLFANVDNLRSHGMCVDALKDTYRAVVLAKLLYASPACHSDKQRIEALVRRGVRLGLYGDVDPTATQLIEDADKSLFKRIIYNQHHVLQQFLPDLNSRSYQWRTEGRVGGSNPLPHWPVQ